MDKKLFISIENDWAYVDEDGTDVFYSVSSETAYEMLKDSEHVEAVCIQKETKKIKESK